MRFNFFFLVITMLLISCTIKAQEPEPAKAEFEEGISINSGLKYIALKDEFISKEKYTGTVPLFMINWSKGHETYKFNISFEVLNSAKLKNYGMTANVTEVQLDLSYLYPIGTAKVFGKNTQFYFGPAPELYVHYRTEDIAKGGLAIYDAYSFCLLISLCPELNAVLPLNEKLSLESNLTANLISFGGKFINPEDHNTSIIKILTPFNAQKYSFETLLKYKLMSSFSASAGYRFNFIRMIPWDYFITANDNLVISLTYRF